MKMTEQEINLKTKHFKNWCTQNPQLALEVMKNSPLYSEETVDDILISAKATRNGLIYRGMDITEEEWAIAENIAKEQSSTPESILFETIDLMRESADSIGLMARLRKQLEA